MRIYKTRWLVRFARRERVADSSLREAIERAEKGLVDADLGGGIVKQRVARPGQGRSGGYRMLVAYRAGDRAVFLYGFAKRERDNIDPDELVTLREIGAAWLAADADRIAQALREEALQVAGAKLRAHRIFGVPPTRWGTIRCGHVPARRSRERPSR